MFTHPTRGHNPKTTHRLTSALRFRSNFPLKRREALSGTENKRKTSVSADKIKPKRTKAHTETLNMCDESFH